MLFWWGIKLAWFLCNSVIAKVGGLIQCKQQKHVHCLLINLLLCWQLSKIIQISGMFHREQEMEENTVSHHDSSLFSSRKKESKSGAQKENRTKLCAFHTWISIAAKDNCVDQTRVVCLLFILADLDWIFSKCDVDSTKEQLVVIALWNQFWHTTMSFICESLATRATALQPPWLNPCQFLLSISLQQQLLLETS